MAMILTINDVEEPHLTKVKEQMVKLGSPTIRVVDCGDYLQAIEGCHRLRAACELGLKVDFDILDQEEIVQMSTLDLEDMLSDELPAGEIAGELHSNAGASYEWLDLEGGTLRRIHDSR